MVESVVDRFETTLEWQSVNYSVRAKQPGSGKVRLGLTQTPQLTSHCVLTHSLPSSFLPYTTKVYRRQILSNLSGVAHSGELVVVLGQSGSGKTSFLNVLSYRTPVSRGAQVSGRILLNGHIADRRSMHAVSAYVEQDMSMFTYLTVEETLLLGAKVPHQEPSKTLSCMAGTSLVLILMSILHHSPS
jgi:ABC-type multidrug transport system fused ATPase/permease subunit